MTFGRVTCYVCISIPTSIISNTHITGDFVKLSTNNWTTEDEANDQKCFVELKTMSFTGQVATQK